MQRRATFKEVQDFIDRHEEWIKRELPGCGYVADPDLEGDGCVLGLRLREITAKDAQKIAELRRMAAKENIELDARGSTVRALER